VPGSFLSRAFIFVHVIRKRMTEKQKMLDGQSYFANDPVLLKERETASEKLFELQRIPPSQKDKRTALLKELLGKTGESLVIEKGFHCDYGYNIELGENFYANVNCTILDCAKVIIGKNVLFGPNVGLYTAGHPLEVGPRVEGIEFAYPIRIGDNVWLGGNVVVVPGVTIGENAVIGAGSVVTKDIPANCVAVGNPCRVIRQITG
jgi:acetyltransferase-like isoleucine patch superfamily enzyme